MTADTLPNTPGRFSFGKNWKHFSSSIDERRIQFAENSLKRMLEISDLTGKTFLDVGCGSGLFSLAAHRLGARVHSFDYDPEAVTTTESIRQRFGREASSWVIEQGSILDKAYLKKLGTFDVVYSWGVLHHTGAMWDALGNVAEFVKLGGTLFIALYNDQGGASRRWLTIKKMYNRSPSLVKLALVLGVGAFFEGRSSLIRLIKLQNPLPFKDWVRRGQERGMGTWYDLVDWTGGYPFEVAKPDAVVKFYRDRGFSLTKLTTVGGGHACNEFVWVRGQA
jgi:SAM-dependent methyltransferase